MGGRSIFVLGGRQNTHVIFETLSDYGQRFVIVQRYLPEIAERGDSRVLLIDGEPVPYALARMPSATTTAAISPPAPAGVGRRARMTRDRWLAREIGPTLARAACCSWAWT